VATRTPGRGRKPKRARRAPAAQRTDCP
jgi:hypothetical protein